MREFAPNETVNGRYTVLRKLGAGAMGSVYLCQDRVEKNIKVALKVLVSENLDDQDVWAKGEYEALTRLRHPNLARVYNFGRIEDTNDYFIVSEFIKGLDLYSSTEYLNHNEVVEIVVQICRALEYIHSQGYVHFDIKPDNILVTRRKTVGLREGSKVQYDEEALKSTCVGTMAKPVVKLIDFGLAEKITGSFSFAIKGTLNYLAPEMLNGQNPDKRADLYSLGVTIYQIVNRDLPFYQDFNVLGGGTNRAKRADLFEVSMKKQPQYLRDLILKLIEEDPADRFQSAKEVIEFINRNSDLSFELETDETRESYFHSPRLIGRKKEMNLLKRLHEMVFYPDRAAVSAVGAEGDEGVEDEPAAAVSRLAPQLVVTTGEMGSGKSRLLEEFRHYLRLNDVRVYTGNCYEANRKAYQPIVEILRQVVYGVGVDSDLVRRYEANVVKLLPELQDVRSDSADGKGGGRPEKEKHYFIEKIAQLLVEAAEHEPYVLVLNNLHWVDDATVDLLEKLFERMLEAARRQEALPLLVVVSQRGVEQSSERCKDLFERLCQCGFGTELAVRRLRPTHIRELLQAMLGLTDIPEAFVDRLEQQTGGNPLFVVETLKALQDEGILRRAGGSWAIKATRYDRVEIPRRMEDLLLMRLDRLEPIKRQILEVMAVIDKPVSPKILQRFRRFRETPILVQIRDLEAAGIVQKLFESNKLQFQIEQPKIREILYSALSKDDRRRYHGEVGETYEEVYKRREEEILEELAWHYQRSDKTERALRLGLRAGDRLKAIYANEQAYGYYAYVLEKTLEGVERREPDYLELFFEVREKLGDLCATMGKYELADEHYGVLLDESFRDDLSPQTVTTLFLRRGKVYEIQGDYDSALRYYKEARNHLATYAKAAEAVERARVYNSIGWAYVCIGKYEKAMTISLEALRVIGNLPERMEHAAVYNTIGSANYYKGNLREAVKYHRQSLQIKENLENVAEIAISLNNLGSAHLASAEYGEALELFRRGLAISEEIGDPYGRAMSLHQIARLYTRVGDLDRAEQHLEQSIRHAKEHNMRYLNLQNFLVRGVVLRERGDYAKAEGSLFRVLTAFSKQGNRAGLCNILLDISCLYRLNGNVTEGASMAEEARRYAEELGIQPLVARSLLELARSERSSDAPDWDRAVVWLEEALDRAGKADDPELPIEISYELAEMLVCRREVSRAKKHYREARDRSREVLDSLPGELKDAYRERRAVRFPDGSAPQRAEPPAGVSTSEESASSEEETTGAAGLPEVGKASSLSPQEAFQRVNQLMVALPQAESLPQYLGQVVGQVIEVTGADVGCVLSLTGRSLSVVASRARGTKRVPNLGKLLVLPLIHRALKSQQPVVIEDVNDHAAAQEQLSKAGVDAQSVSVLPFLQPDGKKGALYLINSLRPGADSSTHLLLVQPFLNLVPMAYLQLGAPTALST